MEHFDRFAGKQHRKPGAIRATAPGVSPARDLSRTDAFGRRFLAPVQVPAERRYLPPGPARISRCGPSS